MTEQIELILGNSNKRFSGVTSTMLQVLSHQKKIVPTVVLGSHNLPEGIHFISYSQFLKLTRIPLKNGRYRVFHARRNNEMIQALIAKYCFGAKIKIAFTSTAQRKKSKFTQWLMRQMDGIISTCEAAASFLEYRPGYGHLDNRKADIIIPHGIDTSIYTPATSKSLAWKSLGLTGEFGIGIFGRVRQSKGIDVLIDAAIPLLKKIPDATVVICGEWTPKDQSYKTVQLEKIQQAGLSDRFIFLGKQPFEKLPGFYRAMSVVAALSRNEGFGLTPLEAMASGCAVLTSEAGAWKEIVRDGVNGYCVPTDDVSATQAKLEQLITNLEMTEKMGQVARNHVLENYTVEKEATALTGYLIGLSLQASQ